MLDIKKLLVKVLTVIKKSMFGSVTNVYWWSSTWTAPNDGMLVLRITPSSTPWYWYINDTAVNSMVGSWSHQYRGNYNGGTETYCIPVKKGATFSTAMMNNINSIQCLYYPMTIGGGYFITSLLSTLVRGWQYVRHEKIAYQNIRAFERPHNIQRIFFKWWYIIASTWGWELDSLYNNADGVCAIGGGTHAHKWGYLGELCKQWHIQHLRCCMVEKSTSRISIDKQRYGWRSIQKNNIITDRGCIAC